MYTAVPVIYAVILGLDAILLIITWTQTHKIRPLVGAVLSLLVGWLLMLPTSSLLGFVGRHFTGTFGMYLASALYAQSTFGLVFFGILVVLTALIGWLGVNQGVAQKEKVEHHHKRSRRR